MFEGAQRAIEKRLQDNWTTTPIKWEGKPFKHNPGEYVAAFILPGRTRLTSIGAAKQRIVEAGVLIIQIFTVRNIGTNQGFRYADTIANVFRKVQVAMTDSSAKSGKIYFRTPYMRRALDAGQDPDHFQMTLFCPFQTQVDW